MKTKEPKAHVLSFTSARDEQIEERRRNYERVLFKNVLGVYTVMEKKGLHAIELIDISEHGMSLQIPINSDLKIHAGDVLNLRLYFASDSFLPVSLKVVRAVESIDEGVAYHQYGCEIDTTFKSYKALYHLFQFISGCAEHGHIDHDHLRIFY